MSKQASAAKADEEKVQPLDLTAEETEEEMAEGAWATIRLPSGAEIETRVSRAEGPHFYKVVRAVNRKWTKNGRKPLDRLTDDEDFRRSVEIACKACFHDFRPRPILVRLGGDRVEIRSADLKDRMRLLIAVPALWQEVNEVCGLEAQTFREVVSEVGEG